MDQSRCKREKRFACDDCDHRFTTTSGMRVHKQAVHNNEFFKCPQSECLFSSKWKTNLTNHFKWIHGTAGSFACDHPGCMFRTSWPQNIAKHKRHAHSDKKPFACDHTGCLFHTKTSSDLSQHKNAVHLNIRNNRCHVCEKGYRTKSYLKSHMTTHEGEGHEMEKCEDCSVNLRSKSSRGTKPTAALCFSCDHPGCCHLCDKRFYMLSSLRDHVRSQHQTKDHDMAKCDHCVTYLKKNHRLSQPAIATKEKLKGTDHIRHRQTRRSLHVTMRKSKIKWEMHSLPKKSKSKVCQLSVLMRS